MELVDSLQNATGVQNPEHLGEEIVGQLAAVKLKNVFRNKLCTALQTAVAVQTKKHVGEEHLQIKKRVSEEIVDNLQIPTIVQPNNLCQ